MRAGPFSLWVNTPHTTRCASLALLHGPLRALGGPVDLTPCTSNWDTHVNF